MCVPTRYPRIGVTRDPELDAALERVAPLLGDLPAAAQVRALAIRGADALLEDDAVRPLRDVVRRGTSVQRTVAAAIIFLSMFLGVLMIYTAAFGQITAYLQRIAFVWGIISIGLLVRSAGGVRWQRRSWMTRSVLMIV